MQNHHVFEVGKRWKSWGKGSLFDSVFICVNRICALRPEGSPITSVVCRGFTHVVNGMECWFHVDAISGFILTYDNWGRSCDVVGQSAIQSSQWTGTGPITNSQQGPGALYASQICYRCENDSRSIIGGAKSKMKNRQIQKPKPRKPLPKDALYLSKHFVS